MATPKPPQDKFEGAEASARQQRMEALETIATFGRRGFEAALAHERDLRGRVSSFDKGARGVADDFRVPAGMRGEMAGSIRSAFQPYVDDARSAASQFQGEIGAQQQMAKTYYTQVEQAVPALRENAKQITEQYRQAYEERQAQIRAEAEAREQERRQAAEALNAQMRQQRELAQAQMAAAAQMSAAQLAAIQASAPVAPPPMPVYRPPAPPRPRQAPTRRSSRNAARMEESRQRASGFRR